MRRCDGCGLPDPGTGELFLVTGFKPGLARDLDTDEVVECEVPIVEPTCRCWRGA